MAPFFCFLAAGRSEDSADSAESLTKPSASGSLMVSSSTSIMSAGLLEEDWGRGGRRGCWEGGRREDPGVRPPMSDRSGLGIREEGGAVHLLYKFSSFIQYIYTLGQAVIVIDIIWKELQKHLGQEPTEAGTASCHTAAPHSNATFRATS